MHFSSLFYSAIQIDFSLLLSSKQISPNEADIILDICVSNNHFKLVDIRPRVRAHPGCVLQTIDTSVSEIDERERERQEEVMNKC